MEVISPSDRASEVIAKAGDWLRFGCIAVWGVDPYTKTVTVYSIRRQTLFLSVEDTLVCDELLPGFRLPILQMLAASTAVMRHHAVVHVTGNGNTNRLYETRTLNPISAPSAWA